MDEESSKLAENWIRKLASVEKYMQSNEGQEPPRDGDASYLCRWLNQQRSDAQKGKLAQWKIDRLGHLGIDVTTRKPIMNRSFRGCGLWSEYFSAWNKEMEEEEKQEKEYRHLAMSDVHWLCGNFGPGNMGGIKSKSLKEHMIRCLQVGDIHPSECSREAPIYDVRHILSFVTKPYRPKMKTTEETMKHPATDRSVNSTLFSCGHRIFSETTAVLIETIISEFPPWWKRMYDTNCDDLSLEATKEFVIDKMSNENKWTDHLMVNKLGSNPNGGSCRITESQHPGPRRLAFSVERHPPHFCKRHRCNVVPLYGYSYSFNPKWWMGCNSLRHYKTLTELGIQLWMDAWDYLDPLSKICPPTGGTLLTYFGCFGGEIQAHQDNAPNMVVPYWHNSQVIGSTVMCLTLFDGMDYDILSIESQTRGKKDYVVEKSFKTSHGSLYLMSAFDDFNSKHRAKFPSQRETGKKKKGLIRVAIVWRWLGRRTFAFDRDYTGWRQRCEVWEDCKTLGETEEIAIECFEEGEVMIDDLEQAVQDIQEGTEQSVKEGIELIGQAISAAAQDLKDCEEVVENVEDLIDMAAMLAHPMSFVYHAGKNIIVNHVEIAKEVTSATQAWESDPREYYQFGFNVGEILDQIFSESDMVPVTSM